jgi:aryl-alcohol dehydrogenase-like predicted oxidoreductase
MTGEGFKVLSALDTVANAHGTTVAAVALAWLLAKPVVTAPITAANTPQQLSQLLPATELALSADDLERFDAASAGT